LLVLCDLMCRRIHRLATNLSIDSELIDRALELSGEKTKKAAVTRALKEFVARHDQKNVADLFGKLEWDPDFDYKTARKRH
jgi:Arc/MetJ family transcription regulator